MRRYCDWAGPATIFMHDRQPQRPYGAHGCVQGTRPEGGDAQGSPLAKGPRHGNSNDHKGSSGKNLKKRPKTPSTKNNTTPSGALALDRHGYGYLPTARLLRLVSRCYRLLLPPNGSPLNRGDSVEFAFWRGD